MTTSKGSSRASFYSRYDLVIHLQIFKSVRPSNLLQTFLTVFKAPSSVGVIEEDSEEDPVLKKHLDRSRKKATKRYVAELVRMNKLTPAHLHSLPLLYVNHHLYPKENLKTSLVDIQPHGCDALTEFTMALTPTPSIILSSTASRPRLMRTLARPQRIFWLGGTGMFSSYPRKAKNILIFLCKPCITRPDSYENQQ